MKATKRETVFTPEATIGPFFPFHFTGGMPGNMANEPGLTHKPAGAPIVVTGRVLDETGAAIRNMILETWQANAFGRYRHPADDDESRPLDPAFDGFARLRTDGAGRYELRTIKPGARPAFSGAAMQRAPHIRMTIFGSGIDRIVTFLFFEDEPLNETDPLLQSVSGDEVRRRLIARRSSPSADGATIYTFDIVLRGERETPFFDDWNG